MSFVIQSLFIVKSSVMESKRGRSSTESNCSESANNSRKRQKTEEPSSLVDHAESVPWPGYVEFFEFYSCEGNKIKLNCKLCTVTKILSADRSTNANFKKQMTVSDLQVQCLYY